MLLAIPPTIIMLSNFGIKFSIIPIFVEILDPPIIHVIGFSVFIVTFCSASISVLSWKPGYDGRNFVIFEIEAWALWEHEKASLTYISAKLARFLANSKSFFFYPKIKGQLEESVKKLKFKN